MPNSFGAPEKSVEQVAEFRQNKESMILLDVREPMELRLANLGDDIISVPLSVLARAGKGHCQLTWQIRIKRSWSFATQGLEAPR